MIDAFAIQRIDTRRVKLYIPTLTFLLILLISDNVLREKSKYIFLMKTKTFNTLFIKLKVLLEDVVRRLLTT